MKMIWRKFRFRLLIIVLSWRWMWINNLNDEVWYLGQKWRLVQGKHWPQWNLCRENERVKGVYESHFRKVKSIGNYIRSFRNGYDFYRGYWYDIWVRKGIQPWTPELRIWGKPFAKVQEAQHETVPRNGS